MKIDFIGWLAPRWNYVFEAMPEMFYNGETILDVGCGQGVLAFLINANQDFKNYSIMGIDGYAQNIARLRNLDLYDKLYFGEMRRCLENRSKSDLGFDYIFCLDVLEHNEKEYSLQVLKLMAGLFVKKLIVTVPFEEPLDNEKRRKKWLKYRAESDNKYNGHVSSWSLEDFLIYDPKFTIFDNRKDLTKSQRIFDTIRRKVAGIDWAEQHLLVEIG